MERSLLASNGVAVRSSSQCGKRKILWRSRGFPYIAWIEQSSDMSGVDGKYTARSESINSVEVGCVKSKSSGFGSGHDSAQRQCLRAWSACILRYGMRLCGERRFMVQSDAGKMLCVPWPLSYTCEVVLDLDWNEIIGTRGRIDSFIRTSALKRKPLGCAEHA